MGDGNVSAFDVVCVPDFSGPNSHIFEARTLFFLASWIERAGAAREFPLHLACIGEPPDSVRWMTERAGATVTVFDPLRFLDGGFINKLRGLEVEGRGEQVLLLDTDTLILSDFSSVAELGPCLAASPDNQPRVPGRLWPGIYEALGMEPPAERMSSIKGELKLAASEMKGFPERDAESTCMLPYYNSGVIWAPWRCDLRTIWEEHLRKVSAHARTLEEPYSSWKEFSACDQTEFATSVTALREWGMPFKRLPDRFNVRWMHISRGAMRLSEVGILHAIGMFRSLGRGEGAMLDGVERYCGRLRRRALEGRGKLLSLLASRVLLFLPSVKDLRELRRFLLQLYERHAAKALSATGRDDLL